MSVERAVNGRAEALITFNVEDYMISDDGAAFTERPTRPPASSGAYRYRYLRKHFAAELGGAPGCGVPSTGPADWW